MIHEILHTMGFVAANAPRQTLSGHVPETNDLMYAGSAPWGLPNLVLDVGRNDYYGDNVPAGVTNLRDSPYLLSATGAVTDLPASRWTTLSTDLVRTPDWLTRTTNARIGMVRSIQGPYASAVWFSIENGIWNWPIMMLNHSAAE